MKNKSIVILTLCAIFLFYKYIAQLFPSLIGNTLMESYGYNGVMLAIMASSYYYSYTLMQIVAGFIIDRYAIRIPMFLAIFVISMMILLFTHTNNFYLMCLSRALMGVGASFATVLYMKSAAQYASPRAFGIISSFLASATMLGAACGGMPIAFLFNKFGWHEGLNAIAIIGFVVAFAVLILHTSSTQQVERKVNFGDFKNVLVKKENWLLLIYSGLTFSPIAILGGLWGTPFLIAKYNINAVNASLFLSIMFIGHAIGSPLWALLSAKMKNKNDLMHFANVVAFIAIIGIIYGDLSYNATLMLFFIFGLSVGCFMLSFEICREINAVYIMGLSVAFINSGEGLVSSIIEPCIGHLLDLSKIGQAFSLQNYQFALFILPCCFILSSLVLLFINKSQVIIKANEFARA